MRINKKYYKVDWDKFKEECLKHLPKGYKFKKNELKNHYKKARGIYIKNRRNKMMKVG